MAPVVITCEGTVLAVLAFLATWCAFAVAGAAIVAAASCAWCIMVVGKYFWRMRPTSRSAQRLVECVQLCPRLYPRANSTGILYTKSHRRRLWLLQCATQCVSLCPSLSCCERVSDVLPPKTFFSHCVWLPVQINARLQPFSFLRSSYRRFSL